MHAKCELTKNGNVLSKRLRNMI